jgi:glycerophosphoryl diester phosphodiesterase
MKPTIALTVVIGLTLLASLAVTIATGAETSRAPALRLLEAKRPLVIAHRGYSQLAPENTLPAFGLAKAAGADLVELDYHHTKDGVPVVIHDADLDRTTDAIVRWKQKKNRVDGRTLAELRSLQAGQWFQPPYPDVKLPTLAEALDAIQPAAVTLIERKAGDAATCVQLLRDKNLINAVVVQSFDWNYLQDFHQLAPQQTLGALGPPYARNGKPLTDDEKPLSQAWVDAALKAGARVVVWNRQITRAAVTYAHTKGMKVWAYTIDDPTVATELLDLGVDGIITNNVALLWRTVALHSPPPP